MHCDLTPRDRMFSVIVTTCDPAVHGSASPEAVARTLAALVPGAISGAVRDVVMTGTEWPAGPNAPGDPDRRGQNLKDLARIADHAGCEFIVTGKWLDGVKDALKIAREPRVLALQAGYAPESGFYDELSDMAWGATLHPTRLLERPTSALHRALPFLAPLAGIVAERERLIQASGSNFSSSDFKTLSFRTWARQVRPMRTMRTRARRVD